MSESIVYCVRNKTKDNLVAYVGCTEKPLEKRKAKHLQNAARGQILKFYSAIRKYGAGAFEWEVIKQCSTYWEALEEERKAIELLKPRYNMTAGGGGIKGFKHPPSSIAKMSAAKKGRPAAWLSGPHAQEIRQKLCRPRAPWVTTAAAYMVYCENAKLANLSRRKPIICITDGTTYPSGIAAANAYNLSAAAITNYCQGKIKNKSGLEFRYIEK